MTVIESLKRCSVILCAVFLGYTVSAQTSPVDSLDIKIGQMILIGFAKPDVDSAVLKEIKAGKAGSLVIFEKNIPAKSSFSALKKIIWTYQNAAPIPLIVAIDQEGGRVNRLKEKYGFTRSITATAMGKAGTLDSVRFYADATAATLAGLGINLNFAPVVDLGSNPDNPIIAKVGRSFSAHEDSVVLLAKEFIAAHRKYNILTSLKHFPGHGSSKADTHLGMADVTNTWEERELTPYKSLIDSGYVDAIMSAHIVNKKLDATGNPGTLSNAILSGILRQRLHFNGVIFSDDMQMHAITKHYAFEQSIKLAILAGVDIMIFSNNITGSDIRTVDRVHTIVRDLVVRGEISEKRIDESFRRIMKLKKQLIEPATELELLKSVKKHEAEIVQLRQTIAAKDEEIRQLKERPSDKKKKRRRKSK